jgi:hypothetical protein
MIHAVLPYVFGGWLTFFWFYLSLLVLYHTNWENADSSNTEYGFYLGLFIPFLVKVMFSVKLVKTGSNSMSH